MSERRMRMFPRVLWNVDSFAALTETQRNNVASRLRQLEETLTKISSIGETSEDTDSVGHVLDIVDSGELDLLILLSVPSSPDQVSPWMVHSSWTFGTSPAKMLETLPPKIAAFLQRNAPFSSAPIGEFVDWAAEASDAGRAMLDAFYESNTVDAALGALIALDVCLAQLLLGFSRQRFNPQLFR